MTTDRGLPPLPKGKINVGEKMTPHYSAAQMHDYATAYAAQEVAREREACEATCRAMWYVDGQFTADTFADAIRARGNT